MGVQVDSTANKPSEEVTGPNPMSLAQGSSMRDWILLDSQSSISLFCNPLLVEDITDAGKKMVITTNAGDLTSTKQATVPGFGRVWYNGAAMTNIIGLGDMVDKHQVTFDSRKEDCFVVHAPQGPVKFHWNHLNLYSAHPQLTRPDNRTTAASAATATIFLETVEHNSSFYTQREFERAKTARRLLHVLGFPTVRDLKTIIISNAIRNCPVTCQDVDIAQQIFGQDIASLKGKTTRKKPTPVQSDKIAVPKELVARQHNVELCFDALFINELPFLSTISRKILYRTLQFVISKKVKDYRSVLDNVLRIYTVAGFNVVKIHCDKEFFPSSINYKTNSR
jgi:hypothetical protein